MTKTWRNSPESLPLAALLLALACAAGPAAGVELSRDGRGQVLLLPLFEVGSAKRTELLVRNTSASVGKAVRLVARDPVGGRPLMSLNLYLAPQDAWRGRLVGDGEPGGESGRLAPWKDASCTFPALDDVPTGIAFDDAWLSAPGGDPGNRLASGSLEIYEMGSLAPELAADCVAVAGRWAEGGLWRSDPAADLEAPQGGLEASASIISRSEGLAFQYQGLALDAFRETPLHTAPSALSPHLGDVDPPVSSTFVDVQLAARRVRVEQRARWDSYPVNAVNAVLMARGLRGEFVSDAVDAGAGAPRSVAAAALSFPTRAFHLDEERFYLPVGLERREGPFAGGDALAAEVVNLDGASFRLGAAPGREACTVAAAALTRVFLTDGVPFSGPCDLQTAILFVAGPPNAGQVEFSFEGRIVSDDGIEFRGRPALGLLLQSVSDPAGADGSASRAGWSGLLRAER